MSDTRNHTTRDQLAAVIREAVIDWNTLGTGKVGADVSTHITDELLASDAIAAVRAAAVAETTAAIEAVLRDTEREAQPLSQSVNPVAAGEASGIHMTTHAVRAALSGGRTALDTTLAQARADALREAAADWDALLPDADTPGAFARWLLNRADTGADQ